MGRAQVGHPEFRGYYPLSSAVFAIEASIDELTGLLNRNAGKNHLSEVLSSLKEDGLCTVALCDLNGLKWVNDTYGHLEGDRFLKVTARTMQEGMEASDFAFRLSGDEFILVFQNKDSDQAAGIVGGNPCALKGMQTVRCGIDYEATFSYGLVTVNGGHRLSVSDVLSVADMQMYIRKRDYHILSGKQAARRISGEAAPRENAFSYHKDQLLDALSESIDDYIFVGNLKTGEFSLYLADGGGLWTSRAGGKKCSFLLEAQDPSG